MLEESEGFKSPISIEINCGPFRSTSKGLLQPVKFDKKKLPYFQTLHSFGFKTLKLHESRILQPEHYQIFGKKIGLRLEAYDDGTLFIGPWGICDRINRFFKNKGYSNPGYAKQKKQLHIIMRFKNKGSSPEIIHGKKGHNRQYQVNQNKR